MEPLSILNPPFEDILNDPRLNHDNLSKLIGEQHDIIIKQVMEWASKAGSVEPIDAMMFAVTQHLLHVTVLNTKLTAQMASFGYKTTQLSLRVERLTWILIWLTLVLGVFSIPLGSEVKKAHQTAMTRAKITRRFRLYDLRHTFATRAAASGVNLPTLSALLGHASIQMTMRYVHPAAEQKQVAIQDFDKFSTNGIIAAAAAAAQKNQRVPTKVTTLEQLN
jgi:hypothetical protein